MRSGDEKEETMQTDTVATGAPDVKARLDAIRAEGRNLIVETIQAHIRATNDLESITWTQYTDYFNDGEQCDFNVYTYNAEINGVEPYGLDEAEEAMFDRLRTGVEEVLDMFEVENYEFFFGDHVRIKITENTVTIESYTEHD